MSDRTFIERLADNAQIKADKYKQERLDAQNKASFAAAGRKHAEAQYWRGVAQQRQNDVFYWLGHVNAYRGIAAGLELREIVEEETDSEPTCP